MSEKLSIIRRAFLNVLPLSLPAVRFGFVVGLTTIYAGASPVVSFNFY